MSGGSSSQIVPSATTVTTTANCLVPPVQARQMRSPSPSKNERGIGATGSSSGAIPKVCFSGLQVIITIGNSNNPYLFSKQRHSTGAVLAKTNNISTAATNVHLHSNSTSVSNHPLPHAQPIGGSAHLSAVNTNVSSSISTTASASLASGGFGHPYHNAINAGQTTSQQQSQQQPLMRTWQCPTCTYENSSSSVVCDMCQSSRGLAGAMLMQQHAISEAALNGASGGLTGAQCVQNMVSATTTASTLSAAAAVASANAISATQAALNVGIAGGGIAGGSGMGGGSGCSGSGGASVGGFSAMSSAAMGSMNGYTVPGIATMQRTTEALRKESKLMENLRRYEESVARIKWENIIHYCKEVSAE